MRILLSAILVQARDPAPCTWTASLDCPALQGLALFLPPVTVVPVPETIDTCLKLPFLPEAIAPLCIWPCTNTPGQGSGLEKGSGPPAHSWAPATGPSTVLCHSAPPGSLHPLFFLADILVASFLLPTLPSFRSLRFYLVKEAFPGHLHQIAHCPCHSPHPLPWFVFLSKFTTI